ncbi:DUF1707 SHOCT-like domain-containing protein [Qaidamihabitans albus]|uniref:DUF1707 SHOCT-like domain-containing protein n=1 Tax=Qaidamihabitans albus TaxID=2795733 RepID=UPI0018F22933|nr:DUF1707 domain-containing protein [Qaidamihabitans albus]
MEPHLRVSDVDREQVVGILRQHTAEGRLSLAEFSERSADAYAARTAGDLAALVADLPADPAPPRGPEPVARGWPRLGVLAVLLTGLLLSTGFVAMAAAGGSMMGGMCP